MTDLSSATTNSFDYTDAIVDVTVATAGYYEITADGAQGGASDFGAGATGGLGAMASGEVFLQAGAILELVVGGEGIARTAGGGGGGSFVIETYNGAKTVDVNEVIAAGGGGSGGLSQGGGGGRTEPTGDPGLAGGDGGANGGAGDGGGPDGGGGGGFTGGPGGGPASSAQAGSTAGLTFDGGVGATGNGGFGGGGGGGSGGGGGGGFGGGGGGGGGINGVKGGGGGGGSFVNNSAYGVAKTAATNHGNGLITITAIMVPTITGAGGTTFANVGSTTDKPFAGVAIVDANLNSPTDTLTLSLSDDNASLAVGASAPRDVTFTNRGGGVYTLTGAADDVTSELDGLTLTAPTTLPSGVETETFTLFDSSSAHAGPPTTATVTADITPACYVRGTRIATARGEVAVEDLRVGDLAATACGGLRPIVWLGHRRLDISNHREPRDVWPVRVASNAFGDGLPRRDLRLSPGHNIAVEGALMPVSLLVNGLSVAHIEFDAVEYWHVELDAHDVVLADGLPAESYLDCGNRTAFANGGGFVEAHPDFQPKHWAETCLPLVKQGPQVEAAKAWLIERLRAQGYEIVGEADPHVLVDGRRIEPVRLSETRLAFALPAGGQTIVLRSDVFVPAHTAPESADDRELGLCVKRLRIDGDDVPLDGDDVLAGGWRPAEDDGRGSARRWTNGAAKLPPGARLVLVDLAHFGLYWRKRVDAAAAQHGEFTRQMQRNV